MLPILQDKLMAPKRSCISTNYDADKLISAVASNRYDQSLLKKVPITESGFDIQEGDFPNFDRIIRQREWTQFCKQLESAILPLVRKFYANAYEQQGNVVQVQGKEVKFDRTMLNHFYSLRVIYNGKYMTYLSDHVDLAKIANTICRPGTQWKISNGEAHSVKANTLFLEANI